MAAIGQDVSANAESGSAFDVVKWVFGLSLMALAIIGNGYFADVALLYRVLGVVASVLLALWVISLTVKGKVFVGMLKEARVEIRKVVWPTRQETLQTTVGVVLIVLVVALLLWLLDTSLGWVVSKLIG